MFYIDEISSSASVSLTHAVTVSPLARDVCDASNIIPNMPLLKTHSSFKAVCVQATGDWDCGVKRLTFYLAFSL